MDKQTLLTGAVAISLAASTFSLTTDTGGKIDFDPTYFPVVEDKVTLDISKVHLKDEQLSTTDIKDLPETVIYNSALLQNIESSNTALRQAVEATPQPNLNQSSTTAKDYVVGRNRIIQLENKVTDLEARLNALEAVK